jgi:hypothetical protein
MRARCLFAVLMAAGGCWTTGQAAPAAAAGPTNALARSVSASQQFIAYSTNPGFAAQLCAVAEKAKREWLRMFDLPDDWRDPVVLVVREREGAWTNAPAVRTRVLRTDKHLKYQIDCVVPPPVPGVELLAGLLEVLCAEYANRDQPTVAGTPYVAAPVPVWLAFGLTELWIGSPEEMLETMRVQRRSARPLTASSLLAADRVPLDSPEREEFLASAWIFVEGLLALPRGTEKLVRLLQELGARKSVSGAFQAVYQPDFPSAEALEKWWNLCVANRSVSTVAQNLTGAETAQRLDAALVMRFPAGDGEKALTLDQVWRQADQAWLRDILKTRLGELSVLRSVAHPLYMATIELEIQAISELLTGKFSRYRRSSAAARQAREAADKKCQSLIQYLDEVEARGKGTDAVQVYFRIFEESETIRRVRVDPIRDYLDEFDK